MFEGLSVLIILGAQSLSYQSSNLLDPFDERRISELANEPEQVFEDEHKICKDRWIYAKPKSKSNIQYCGEIEYLQNFKVEEIKYVGQLDKGGAKWALVTTPSGEINRVQIGNRIGKDHGEIKAITESYIVFTELISDGNGGWSRFCNYLIREGSKLDLNDLPRVP